MPFLAGGGGSKVGTPCIINTFRKTLYVEMKWCFKDYSVKIFTLHLWHCVSYKMYELKYNFLFQRKINQHNKAKDNFQIPWCIKEIIVGYFVEKCLFTFWYIRETQITIKTSFNGIYLLA